MVVEADIGPTLNSYKLIVLTDTHVSKVASTGLAAWVAAGGTLFATAGAGGFDELNKTNVVMSKLLGIASSHGTIEPDDGVTFIKQVCVVPPTPSTLVSFDWALPADSMSGCVQTGPGQCHRRRTGLCRSYASIVDTRDGSTPCLHASHDIERDCHLG
jgi:hypothetical protein